jgi:20S proteasome alpha/beta subunit
MFGLGNPGSNGGPRYGKKESQDRSLDKSEQRAHCAFRPPFSSKSKRLPRRKAVTVAIAAKCGGGVVLVADKEITLTDGSKTVGNKIYSREFTFGTVTLASSAEDGLAAESLAGEIFDRLTGSNMAEMFGVVNMVKEQMQQWHGAYAPGTAPGLSFLLIVSGFGKQELFVAEPPRTIVQKHAYAIGSGARVAQPILDRLIPSGEFQPRPSMMFLVYMAKRAARETAFVGGGFDGLYIPVVGPVRWVSGLDMLFAEEMVYTIDSCIDGVLQFLMMLSPESSEEDGNPTAKFIKDHLVFVAGQLAKQEPFSSLEITP